MKLKYLTGIISFIALVLIIGMVGWVFLGIYYVEQVFPFYPLIDTKLPPGFSQAKFENIQVGMTKTEVLEILPAPVPMKPVHRDWSINQDSWFYGQDSACPFGGDFAWFEFEISFDEENRVIRKYYNIYYD